MSKFQLILTGVFGAFIVIGVLIFAFARPDGNQKSSILVWGPISDASFYTLFSTLPLSKDRNVSVEYIQKKESDFDKDFVEALASGNGPDVVFISQDGLLKQKNKLFPIPYETYSERDFKNTFVQEGELFLAPEGIFAFPIIVDPLVMYWNRNTFSSKGVAEPPRYWDEFWKLSENFTKKDGALNITKATVPLGEFANVTNAKEIIATLMFQAGTPIVTDVDYGYVSELSNDFGYSITPAYAAVNFYTQFSDPDKPHYSWNRSLPDSQTMFIAGDLAVYFGFASELETLRLKNPNLNFDVAPMPQSRESEKTQTKITYGRMQALAVTKNTRSLAGAFQVIAGLSSANAVIGFSEALKLPPVRRDLLSKGSKDPFNTLFYQSALWSRGWLDPDRGQTRTIFQNMIESITGGRASTDGAVGRAQAELTQLLGSFKPIPVPQSI